MKLLLATTMLLAASLCHSQANGDTYATASKSGQGQISLVFTGVEGFMEKDKDGNIKGLLLDFMVEFESYVKEKKGITLSHEIIHIEEGNFSEMMRMVKNGQGGVFGLSNVSIKEDRKKDYLFSPPYLDNVSLIVTHNSVPDLKSISEINNAFKGMEAYSVESSTYLQRLVQIKKEHMPDLQITNVSDGREIMSKLVENPNSFAVLDLNFYLEALSKRYPLKRHPSCDITDDPFGIVMPKSNDWAPILAEFFDSGFIGSSRYSEIISNNLGSSALRLINSVKN